MMKGNIMEDENVKELSGESKVTALPDEEQPEVTIVSDMEESEVTVDSDMEEPDVTIVSDMEQPEATIVSDMKEPEVTVDSDMEEPDAIVDSDMEEPDVTVLPDEEISEEKGKTEKRKRGGKAVAATGSFSGKKTKELKAQIVALEQQAEEQEEKVNLLTDRLQRLTAEFDNYKKRSLREKDALYTDATCDALKEILPVLDNFERAIHAEAAGAKEASAEAADVTALKTGLMMVYKQFMETLEKLGLEKIEAVGKTFDPHLHNAVMHIEDDAYGESEVVEELQVGYKVKDRIVRYSYVKVAN